MDVSIDTNAPEPVYEQIVRQIHEGVASGRLEPGALLPPVRQLATDLMLNRNTVARAYKMLEEQGVIQTAGRKGTFVRPDAAVEVTEARNGRGQRILRQAIKRLTADGLSPDEIDAIFTSAMRLEKQRRATT
jgi:GntR family transcriptional regulator